MSMPSVIAWESTRACNYACAHCRAEAQKEPDPDQLTTQEVIKLVDQISELSRPIFIISGGDPLKRGDVFEIASHASEKGLRVVMSPSGSNITPRVVEDMLRARIRRISISLDGSTKDVHDEFRGVSGAFGTALSGISYARAGGLAFQVNTTVSQHNLSDLPNILSLATNLGAVSWDVFMLVPTGRGRVDMEISPQQYEETLNFIYKSSLTSKIPIKMTCSPHYIRVISQREQESLLNQDNGSSEGDKITKVQKKVHGGRGCMVGNGYYFISHIGKVYGCGFLPIPAGDIHNQSLKEIYLHSNLFKDLRNRELLQGKCSLCEYKYICGGCRARAFSIDQNLFGEEPYCTYMPPRRFSLD